MLHPLYNQYCSTMCVRCRLPTLVSSGLKSIKRVSSMTLVVSTSSTSLFRQLMRLLKAPEATEAGCSFAKLLNPSIAALRSSNNVALCRRPLSVEIVFVAFCFAGACDSRSLNIVMSYWHASPSWIVWQRKHIHEVSLVFSS